MRVFGGVFSTMVVFMASYVRMVHFNYRVAGVVTALVHDWPVEALALEIVSDGTTSNERSVQADAANTIAEEHDQGSPLACGPASALSAYLGVASLFTLRARVLEGHFKSIKFLGHWVAILFVRTIAAENIGAFLTLIIFLILILTNLSFIISWRSTRSTRHSHRWSINRLVLKRPGFRRLPRQSRGIRVE